MPHAEDTETITFRWTTVLIFLVTLFLGISGLLYTMFTSHETKTEVALSLKADKVNVERTIGEIKEELIRNRTATDGLRDAITNQLTDIRKSLQAQGRRSQIVPSSKMAQRPTQFMPAFTAGGNNVPRWEMRP